MLVIDDTIVSDDLAEVKFVCNLKKCKGVCCIEGDAGAPLLEEEIAELEDGIDEIKVYMTEKGIRVIEEMGVFEYDMFGEFVTPLINGRECAFVNFTDGIAWCAIEKAFEEGKIKFRKPVSCHLYPVRITINKTHVAVNYHQWDICRYALVQGKRENVPLYRFLKEPLIRRFGKAWYEKLEKAIAGGKDKETGI